MVLSALLFALYGYAHLGASYAFFGTPLNGQIAPALQLPDDEGGTFDLTAQHGDAVLVYFGYTHCPDVCPTTLAALHAVFARLGPAKRDVEVVFVTLDPVRDSPVILRDYLSSFDPIPIGLTGLPRQIASAATLWNISWQTVDNGTFLNHTSVITLVGPDGRMRARYGFNQLDNPSAIAQDILHVIRSK